MKRVIGVISLAMVIGISLFSLATAWGGGVRGIGLLGMWFFYTFGIIVVLAQLIPAGIVLFSFIAGHFSPLKREEKPVPVT